MEVYLNRGPQYKPLNTIALTMGTPNKVPLILGNPQIPVVCGGFGRTSSQSAASLTVLLAARLEAESIRVHLEVSQN